MSKNPIPIKNKELYEKYSESIDNELSKKRSKWTLTAVPSISYEDICQIIRTHIYIKIHLYNPFKASIEAWLNSVISNQIRNLVRNLYQSCSSPCSRCAASEENNGCKIYSVKSPACPLLDHWTKSKKSSHDIKLPLPMENHLQEVFDMPCESLDIDKSSENLHEKMLKILRPNEAKVYKLLYIEHKSEEEVSSIMEFKSSERGRKSGYKQLGNIKKSIVEKAKKVLYSGDIDFT